MSRRRIHPLLPALALALVVLAAGPSRALATDCKQTIYDGSGYIFDFEGIAEIFGAPRDGGSNGPAQFPPGPVLTDEAWDGWGNVFVYSPRADLTAPTAADRYLGPGDGCTLSLGGREIAFPVVALHGLEVQHRWYPDPGRLPGARILTLLRNPGAAPIGVTVAQGDPSGLNDLGSDAATAPRTTSDGSGVFSAASYWGVSADGLAFDVDPALAHVWDGPGGAMRASEVVLGGPQGRDTLYWAWNLTIPPERIVAFLSYEIQVALPGRETSAEVAEASAQAEARVKQAPASIYAGMSAPAIAATMNWARPAPTATIAPVAGGSSALAPVRLDGSGSTGASGLPQCPPRFAWRSDDGATGSSAMFSHFFSPGGHTARLTVTNTCGGGPRSAEVGFEVEPALKLIGVKVNRRAGTATLRLRALGAGRLSLAGTGVRREAKPVTKAGNVSLLVKPVGKARRALAGVGRARVSVTAALTASGGKPSTVSKTVVLRRVAAQRSRLARQGAG
jgi:hypothetical protein